MNSRPCRILFFAAFLVATALPAAARLDPEQLCNRERARRIGEYGRCRLDTAQKARAAGIPPSYEACDAAFAARAPRDCSNAAEIGFRETPTSTSR